MYTGYVGWGVGLSLFFGTLVGAPGIDPLERLKQGNNRYVTSTTVCHTDWTAKRASVVDHQKPFAVVVCCSDSRVPPEIIFDQSLGHLFVVRVAGNVIDEFAMGSLEYGVSVLGAKLILILGHANCGAVEAALKGVKFDNHIQAVLDDIAPAITMAKEGSGDRLERVIKQNVRNVEEKIKASKPLLAKLLKEGSVHIEGGYYHLDTGRVEFFR